MGNKFDIVLMTLFGAGMGLVLFTGSVNAIEISEKLDAVRKSYRHVAVVIATSTGTGSCKEMNLRYYHWFKSFGVFPEVVVGRKLGQGHVWLVWDGKIYDSTDVHYNGVSAKELSRVYVPAEYEVFK